MAVAVCATGALAMGVAACGKSGSGGGTAKVSGSTLTIYSSVPLQGGSGDQGKAIQNGAKIALDQAGGKIGKFTINYKPLDDSLASTGAADEGKASQNARQALADKTSVGYIGEYNSSISKVTIPLLNKGGIMQISPANTYAGLTTNKVPGTEAGEPGTYYPTGKRTYARIPPIDTVQAAALLLEMKKDSCKSLHIWNSKSTYSAGLARNVVDEAKKAKIAIEGNDVYDPQASNYRSLAANVKSDCFLSTGEIEQNANQGIKDVAVAHPSIKVYESDGDCLNASADPSKGVPPQAAPRFKCTIATLNPKSFGPEGTKFFDTYKQKYGAGQNPDPYAIYGYECMKLLLDSIKTASANGKNDISRVDVVDQVFKTKNRKSVLGTYSIDAEGDSSITKYGVYHIVGGKLEFLRAVDTKPLLPKGAKDPTAK
ncbi:MAG: branched-chain amino acid transport system substrate-binding protein [Thermoleophilaceae bacterium]|nr:branched-chain amino acid transport system substrate-binding protein [Thermoleophilaceae bacterium]